MCTSALAQDFPLDNPGCMEEASVVVEVSNLGLTNDMAGLLREGPFHIDPIGDLVYLERGKP